MPGRCFSFQFYIKPQHHELKSRASAVVSHSNSTSNHNRYTRHPGNGRVVSHSNSTSNHNAGLRCGHSAAVVSHSNSTSNHNYNGSILVYGKLFLIPILHQTTTCRENGVTAELLFLIPILHQTTTDITYIHDHRELFLIPILHQTTTSRMAVIHILHVTHMTPMHKTSCRTPGKLVGCNFVFQRAIYQKNSSC